MLNPLILYSIARQCLILGVLAYVVGIFLGIKADPSRAFARILLQRIGVGLVMEWILLTIFTRVMWQGPPLWETLLLWGLMLGGVPALVLWQIKQAREVATGVRPARRPHWLLVAVTAAGVMGLLGALGYFIGGILGPGEGFAFNRNWAEMGAIIGAVLGLLIVRGASREPV